MARGFLLAITTALVSVVLLLYLQTLATTQNNDLNRMSNVLVSQKVLQTWSDVNDGILTATNLMILKDNNTATFFDSLPANYTVQNFLSLYSLFISRYYETPDTDINFIGPAGEDLSNLSSKIMIMPFNIEYGYDTWWKNNVFLFAPKNGEENLTAITMIYLNVKFTDAIIYCTPANPSGPVSCDQSSYKKCSGNKQKMYLNLSFSDYQNRSYNFPETCFDETFPNTETLRFLNASGNQDLIVEFGKLTGATTNNGLALRNGYPSINVTTKLILNTSDFYISYLSKLEVSAIGYNTSMVDWA